MAFQAAQVIYLGYVAIADVAAHRREQCHATRRHVDHLAGKLAAIRQHVAAEQIDADALVAPAFLGMRQHQGLGLQQRQPASILRIHSPAD